MAEDWQDWQGSLLYSPEPDISEMDRYVQLFTDQASKLVASGKDPDKVEAALQQKISALNAAYKYWGDDLFKQMPKPTGSDLDAQKHGYDLPNYEPVNDSPLKSTGLASPQAPGLMDALGTIGSAAQDVGLTVGNMVIPAGSIAKGGIMLGSYAEPFRTIADLAGITDQDKVDEFANKAEDALTYQPKTKAGEAAQLPLEALSKGIEYTTEKIRENPLPLGGEGAATFFNVGAQAIPFVFGLRKGAARLSDVAKEKKVPETPTEEGVAQATPIYKDFIRQQDLFDSPEANASEGVRDMFSGKMENAEDVEGRRQAAALANSDKELPQRTPEEDVALEKEYGFQQMEKRSPSEIPSEEPPAQADLWNFGATGDTSMAEAFRQAQLARGVDEQGRNIFPRSTGTPERTINPPQRKNFPLNAVDQQELPLQGGQADLFPMEDSVARGAEASAPEITPTAPINIPKTNVLFAPSSDEVSVAKTPEFKNWFGNSKVVDDKGEALRVYHGTSKDADFSRFKTGQRGSWFTASPEDASMYAKDNDSTNSRYNPDTRKFERINTASRVIPAYLKIENPYVMTDADWQKYKYVENYAKHQRDFFSQLKAKGYDGVRVDENTWVVFDPRQIKSAIGNRGTFDPKNPNILFDRGSQANGGRLAHSIYDALDNGELTGQHVLDAIADNHESIYGDSPKENQAINLVDELRKKGERFGGLDTGIELIDPEKHVEVLDRIGAWDRHAGFYDPQTNKIYINGEQNLRPTTLVHEVAHAISHKAISDGEAGKLTGKARDAFLTLNNVFETLRDPLKDSAFYKQGNPYHSMDAKLEAADKYQNMTYGLKNLHEMVSEIYSNPAFRDHLKSLKLDSLDQAKLGMGRLTVGKIRNMYQAVVKSLSNMLGLSPKAENAFDAMFAAHENFFNSFSDKEAADIRKSNARNTEPKFAPASDEAPEMYERGLNAKRATQSLGDRAKGTRTQGQLLAAVAQRELSSAARKESTPNEAIRAYADNSNPKALDKYPETKKVLDETFKPYREAGSLHLANETAASSNQSAKTKNMAATFLKNKDSYLTETYLGADKARKVWRLAQQADAKKGTNLSPAEAEAVSIRDEGRKFVRENLLPNGHDAKRDISTLHSIGEALGIPTKDIASTIERDAPKGTDAKALVAAQKEAISKALNEKMATVKRPEALVDRILKELGGLDKDAPLARYERAARLGDVFTTKGSVPPELHRYLGRVEDMGAIVANTIIKQHNGVAQLRLQNQLKEALDGKGLWSKAEAPENAKEIEGDQYGPLKGMYASPEVHKFLKGNKDVQLNIEQVIDSIMGEQPASLTQKGLATAQKGWSSTVRGLKIFRLTTDIANHVMYAMGALGKLASAGFNFTPAEMAYGIRETLNEFRSPRATPEQLELARNGLLDFHRQRELSNLAREASVSTDIKSDPIMDLLHDKSGPLNEARKKFIGLLGAMDYWATKANYKLRKNQLEGFYNRIGVSKDAAELEREAADQTKQTNTTFERSFRLARALEGSGVSISLPYALELHRNVFNSGLLGFQDISRGIKAGDAKFVYDGLKRVTGTLAAITAGNSLYNWFGQKVAGSLGASSTPISEEDSRTPFLQDEGSRFRAGQASEIHEPSIDADQKNAYMWDPGGAWDQFYSVSQPLARLAELAQNWNKPGYDAHKQLGRILDNFTAIVGTNPVTKAAMKFVRGNAPSWAYRDPESYAKAKEKLVNTGILSPENADRLLNLADVTTPNFIKKYQTSKDLDWQMQLLTQIGYGVTKMPKDAGLSGIESNKFNTTLDSARKPLISMIKDDSDYSPKSIEKQYIKSLKEVNDALEKMRDAVEFAKGNKVDEGDLYEALKAKGVNKKVAASMGDTSAAELLFRNLKGAFKDKLTLTEESKQEEVSDRFMRKMDILDDLMDKYIDMTPEQIKDL